jgi:hypothetical protein
MPRLPCHLSLLLITSLGPVASLAAQSGSHASGGGTYSPGPGLLSQFQFSEAHVQCKIAHAVMPDGTELQMFMASTSVTSVTITGSAAVITGQMTSIVRLRPPGGASITLSESVPFTVNAQDNGTPGAGTDFFGLTVTYNPNAPLSGGLNQYKFFGATPTNPNTTFSGVLLSGNIVVD